MIGAVMYIECSSKTQQVRSFKMTHYDLHMIHGKDVTFKRLSDKNFVSTRRFLKDLYIIWESFPRILSIGFIRTMKYNCEESNSHQKVDYKWQNNILCRMWRLCSMLQYGLFFNHKNWRKGDRSYDCVYVCRSDWRVTQRSVSFFLVNDKLIFEFLYIFFMVFIIVTSVIRQQIMYSYLIHRILY